MGRFREYAMTAMGTKREPPERAERLPDPVVEAYRAGVDATLLKRNLRLTPEERLLQAIALQRRAEEVRKAGHRALRRR